MPFVSDLLFGKKYELLLLDYIDKGEYDDVELPPNKAFKDWDVLVRRGDSQTAYEVKADRLTAKTGNFCIEYECSGEPSGISSTKADYYAYFVVNGAQQECYIIPVAFIRKLITTGSYKKMNGGDKWKARFFLVPKAEFCQFLVERKVHP